MTGERLPRWMAVITGRARRRGEAGRAASGDREAGMREETRTGVGGLLLEEVCEQE